MAVVVVVVRLSPISSVNRGSASSGRGKDMGVRWGMRVVRVIKMRVVRVRKMRVVRVRKTSMAMSAAQIPVETGQVYPMKGPSVISRITLLLGRMLSSSSMGRHQCQHISTCLLYNATMMPVSTQTLS